MIRDGECESMLILQLSDFHFNAHENSKDEQRYKQIVDALLYEVKAQATPKKKESLLVAVCGDIVDQKLVENRGKNEGYRLAEAMLERIHKELSSCFQVVIEFVPGNHDRIGDSFQSWFQFVEKFSSNWEKENETCICTSLDGTDFIWINSAIRGIERGYIDYNVLEQSLKNLGQTGRKVFVLHHTVMSMDDQDSSSIINAAQFISFLNQFGASLVLHGHTHGMDALSIGLNDCVILGVGALFTRDNNDVNSQFNLIRLNNGVPTRIINYTYHNDKAPDGQSLSKRELTVPGEKRGNIFFGERISDVYHQLIHALQEKPCLYNVILGGKFKFDDFESDVMNCFGKKKDFEWDYYTLAQSWQANYHEDYLCFCHGEHYVNKAKGTSGIEYIAQMLKNKKTSSRAVLSAVGMQDIYCAGDDSFLPSLMIVQFGFDGDDQNTLKITAYLRSLEACRFLKINICELLVLAQRLKECGIYFTEIEVMIHAFRVQCLKDFSCFVRSKLDRISQFDIQEMVVGKDYKQMSALLKEKSSHVETVIVSDGLYKLKEVLDWYEKKHGAYPEQITALLDEVIKKSELLKAKRRKTSICTDLDKDEHVLKESVQRLAAAMDVEGQHDTE